MSKQLAEESPAARAVWDEVDATLGEKLSTLAFEGPESELTSTANAQPAIVAASMATLAALKERHPELPDPVVAAGHSLGEYSALVAAGALALADVVKLVRLRGRAMQEAVPPGVGAMAAVIGLTAEEIEEVCEQAAQGEVVQAANLNSPGQVVIAGHKAAVARVAELVPAKAKLIPLNVSAPFHCALMAPAARAVETALREVPCSPPRFPVIANVDARPNTDPVMTKMLLVRQTDGTVRWQETTERLLDYEVTHALEIGPGKVLAGLVRRTAKQIRVLSLGGTEQLEQVEAFLALPLSRGSSVPPPTGRTMPPPTT